MISTISVTKNVKAKRHYLELNLTMKTSSVQYLFTWKTCFKKDSLMEGTDSKQNSPYLRDKITDHSYFLLASQEQRM